MKKRKALKSAVLVGLSAVLVGGVATAAAGCGNTRKANEIVVSMFSSSADQATNQKIADQWAANYTGDDGTKYTVRISNKEDKAEYFNKLTDEFSHKTIGDVMYLAPSNVKYYARSGRVIDLTPYIAGNTELEANLNDVWPAAINFYGLDTRMNAFIEPTYTMGQSIEYDADGAEGAGFYAAAGNKVGIYGLPKDYSNFSMGYNRVYFSEEMKQAYTTTKVTQERSVKGARGDENSLSSSITYDASTGSAKTDNGTVPVIRYAVDGSDGIQKDKAANIINPGIPVKILPFNFYMWKTYQDALSAGDPIASLVHWATGDDGYTVTIPGFPDEPFDMPEDAPKDPNAPYDTSMGHITYTYAEYGALLWSLTYYLNTFAWDDGQNPLTTTAENPGKGGIKDSVGDYRTVYGGEQYEGGAQDGFQLYVLPWLYSNDADLINTASTLCVDNTKQYNGTTITDSAKLNVTDPKKWAEAAGEAAETVKKLRLNGQYEDVQVQYGLNSQKFIETYGAFLAIGSDWNGNPNDSPVVKKENSGWGYFRAGRSIFYGAGTWDSAVRNEEDKKDVDLGQMPTPVAERYALYSKIKDANYNMVVYSNTGNVATGTDVKDATSTEGLKVYTQDEIIANQVCRQDKWGARMDSVGYAVTCMSLEGSKPGGAPTEKTKAAASLCAALTVSAKPQISLTYGGAQLPNFRSQCEDLLHYNDPDYDNYEHGAFKDMITFDGDAAGNNVWDQYYTIAKAMGDAAYQNKGGTVAEFLAGKTIELDDGSTVPVKYDPDFADTRLNDSSFARADSTAKSRYSFAMKVLQMVAFRKSDFDLFIRMQYGLNSVRDSSMYTYNDNWLTAHDARDASENNLCYYRARSIKADGRSGDFTKEATLKRNPNGTLNGTQFVTPFVWCMQQASRAQTFLEQAINTEKQSLAAAGILQ